MTSKELAQDKRLREIYKSSFEARQAKLNDQKLCCAICGRPFVKGASSAEWDKEVYTAFFDHYHGCCPRRLKKFCGLCNRGLLCYICNKFVVGILEMKKIDVNKLAAYMNKWGAMHKERDEAKAKAKEVATVRKKKTSVRRCHAGVSR
jgi:hypothetical protein